MDDIDKVIYQYHPHCRTSESLNVEHWPQLQQYAPVERLYLTTENGYGPVLSTSKIANSENQATL